MYRVGLRRRRSGVAGSGAGGGAVSRAPIHCLLSTIPLFHYSTGAVAALERPRDSIYHQENVVTL